MKEPKIKTYGQAREALLDMQSQIIHGSNCFAEIAEVMRQLKEENVGRTSGEVGPIQRDSALDKLAQQFRVYSDSNHPLVAITKEILAIAESTEPKWRGNRMLWIHAKPLVY